MSIYKCDVCEYGEVERCKVEGYVRSPQLEAIVDGVDSGAVLSVARVRAV